ncbi:MAG: hypothetical protein QOH51_70 [Acidobacteriota bacterium]|jgi:hypothetical protein|nr:hypothetical protein [Acidobacteriota bacterium]
MATVTIEVPDELSELVAQAGDCLPKLLAQNLKEPMLPAHVYRCVLDFLASRPTPDQNSEVRLIERLPGGDEADEVEGSQAEG